VKGQTSFYVFLLKWLISSKIYVAAIKWLHYMLLPVENRWSTLKHYGFKANAFFRVGVSQDVDKLHNSIT